MRHQKASASSSDPVAFEGVGATDKSPSKGQRGGKEPIAIAVPVWDLHERETQFQSELESSWEK